MKRPLLLAPCAALVLVGCGGQSNSGGYGGFDSSLGTSNKFNSASNPNSPAPVPNVAAWPSENGAPVLVRGVNLPAFEAQTGHDLGKNPFRPGDAVWYKADAVDKQFQELADIGFNVIKMPLFENGEGLKVKDGSVSGLDETFTKNLEDLVERARAHKVKLYLAFTDGWPQGLKNPASDKKAQDAYFKNAVGPIARKFKANEGVFAFDFATNASGLTMAAAPALAGKESTEAKAVTWDQARAFIKSGIEVIKKQDPERLVTSGGASLESIGKGQYANLGLDFYDLKVFSDKGELPIARELRLDRPVIVGSFGQSAGELSDEAQASALKAFVLSAPKKGYAGYLFANYGGKDVKDINGLINAEGKARPALEALKNVMKEATPPPATTTGSVP
jgi:hypothetical protein